MKGGALVAILGAAGAAGCAHALHEPPPIADLAGPPSAPESDYDRLLATGEVLLARRTLEDARAAETAFLQAAAQDPARPDALLAAVRAKTWRIEHEKDPSVREGLAVSAVQTAQWCRRAAPSSPACDYELALALGLQARERRATAADGVREMMAALRRAIAGDPALDEAGPHRVLALVLLRAPGWPLGPGDREEGLEEARRAIALRPTHPPNLLALAEALGKNGRKDESRAAYSRALDAARQSREAGDPDAAEWEAEARAALVQSAGSPP